MKNLVFVVVLFLAACTKQNSQPAEPIRETNEPETFEVIEVTEQVLLIQDVKVEVTRALVHSSINDPVAVFIVKTPQQKLSYTVTMNYYAELAPAPNAELLSLIESSREGKPEFVDLMIEQQLEQNAIRNVLYLGRCTSSPVVPKLIEVLSKPRSIIYFGFDNSGDLMAKNALRWDMQQKRFLDVVELGDWASPAKVKGVFALLSPSINIRKPNREVYLNSAFLSAALFGGECDYLYSSDEKPRNSEEFDPNDFYLPEFDPKHDKFYSSLMDERLLDINFALASSEGIYWYVDQFSKLKKELIEKAKSDPLFLKFTQGQ